MAVEVLDRDLDRAKASAYRMTIGRIGKGDFRRSVEAVVTRGEKLSVVDMFIEAGLAGLQDFGVEDSKQILFVNIGLASLGVAVSVR